MLTRDLRFLELKTTNEQPGRILGLASTYGGEPDAYGDVVMPGAFTATLNKKKTRVVLWGHDPNEPIGIATLTDSAQGLRCDIQLELDLATARDAYVRVKKGLVDGISIGYQTIRERVVQGVRQLLEVDLWECSLVTFPANPSARITAVKGKATDAQLVAGMIADLRLAKTAQRLANLEAVAARKGR